jgi:hypothetical protein
LGKALSANFMQKLSYSTVTFAGTDNALSSPWGQAYSLLSDVATFPRKALTDIYFFRGLKVSKRDLIKAMNVADDALCRDLGTFDEDRCHIIGNSISSTELRRHLSNRRIDANSYVRFLVALLSSRLMKNSRRENIEWLPWGVRAAL